MLLTCTKGLVELWLQHGRPSEKLSEGISHSVPWKLRSLTKYPLKLRHTTKTIVTKMIPARHRSGK